MYERLWRDRDRLFVSENIRLAADTTTVFATPEPTGRWYKGWENHGLALHREMFGEPAHRAGLAAAFAMPMPAATTANRIDLLKQVALLGAFFGVHSARSGLRGTHLPGMGARGIARIRDSLDIPEHAFFRPGRTFACRLRHSNASFADDAALVIRGAALKFDDSDGGGPFDLLMNTGATPAFYCPWSFMEFARARGACTLDNWEPQRELLRNLPAFHVGAIGGMRAAPTSYADLSYYSQAAVPYRSLDGGHYCIRYRMVRPDLEHESGLLTPDQQRRVHDQRRDPADPRPHDYLRTEFHDRVQDGGVAYGLQVQLRAIDTATDTHELFNPMRLWDTARWPWHDLADIELYAPLTAEENAATRFWPGNKPAGLGLFDAVAARDYNALTWIRTHVYALAALGRRGYLRKRRVPRAFTKKERLGA